MFANTTLDMQLSTQNHLNAFGFWRCNYFVRFFRPGPVQKTSSLDKSHLKKICSWSFADPATCIYHPFPSSLHLSKFKTYFFNTFHCSHIKHPRRPESITSNISLRALSGTWRQRPGRPRRPPLAAPWRRARPRPARLARRARRLERSCRGSHGEGCQSWDTSGRDDQVPGELGMDCGS